MIPPCNQWSSYLRSGGSVGIERKANQSKKRKGKKRPQSGVDNRGESLRNQG
ncbi:MAG: hypothetical protein ACMUEL_06450 [Flavobacteriales bacterium Tduv]